MEIHICSITEYDAETRMPTIVNPDSSTFYLVPTEDGISPDLFTEWVYVNGAWEMFGSAKIDLSGYLTDVTVNGTSVVTDGVAEIPIASRLNLGVIKVDSNAVNSGLYVNDRNGFLETFCAPKFLIKNGDNTYMPIVPSNQHESTFYGLAKASGDTTQSQSSNTVGTYTDEAKASIQTMLGVPSSDDVVSDVQINGTSIVQDGVANVPIASVNVLGLVKVISDYGIGLTNTNVLKISGANDVYTKAGTNDVRAITPKYQHSATFYGLAKSAGDTTQSASSNAVGNYTEDAKAKIQNMLGLSEKFELINVVSIDADAERIVCNTDMSGQQFSLKAAAAIIYAEPGSEQTGNATLIVGFSPFYNGFSTNFEQLSIPAGIRTTPQKNIGWAKVEGIIPEIRTDTIDGTSGYITMLECGTFAMSEVKRCANETNNAKANGYIQTVYVSGKTFGAGSFIRVWGIRA